MKKDDEKKIPGSGPSCKGHRYSPELERRRAAGRSMLKRGASNEEVSEATGAPLRTVRSWRTEITRAADAPTAAMPPPEVSFCEKSLRELADVPLGAW